MPPKAVRRSLGGMKRFMLVQHVAEAFNGIATAILRHRGSGKQRIFCRSDRKYALP